MIIPRILIVDDDTDRALLLAEGLRIHGFEPRCMSSARALATNGDTAIFDFAIVEMMLSGTQGFELARALRHRRPAPRVMLISEYHFSESQLAKVDCGAMAFVPRPVSIESIVEFMREKLRAAPLVASEQKL